MLGLLRPEIEQDSPLLLQWLLWTMSGLGAATRTQEQRNYFSWDQSDLLTRLGPRQNRRTLPNLNAKATRMVLHFFLCGSLGQGALKTEGKIQIKGWRGGEKMGLSG